MSDPSDSSSPQQRPRRRRTPPTTKSAPDSAPTTNTRPSRNTSVVAHGPTALVAIVSGHERDATAPDSGTHRWQAGAGGGRRHRWMDRDGAQHLSTRQLTTA